MRGLKLSAALRELDFAAADAQAHQALVGARADGVRKRRRPKKGYVKAFARSDAPALPKGSRSKAG